MKNSAVGFYSIEYAWKKGEHPKRGEFSPDFFIRIGSDIFVVEIKGDEEINEPAPDNVKKYEYAREHFERVNTWLADIGEKVSYQLNFLSPRNYNAFFQTLREGGLRGFRSELDVVLAGGRTG
jgi:type III restriction enzyme